MDSGTQNFVACVSVDRHGVIRDANNSAHEATGRDELIGLHLSRIIPPRLHGRFRQRFLRQIQSGASRTVKLPLLRADGHEATVDLIIHVLPSQRVPELRDRAAQLV